MVPSPHNDELFLVRIWHEHSTADPGTLRGWIVQVSSKQQFSFTSLDEARDFIILRMEGTEDGLT